MFGNGALMVILLVELYKKALLLKRYLLFGNHMSEVLLKFFKRQKMTKKGQLNDFLDCNLYVLVWGLRKGEFEREPIRT